MKGTITGILKGKMERVGTRSEGPEYYIQPTDDYKERWDIIHVRKQTHRWEEDPNLHNLVDKEVEILADIIETRTSISIDYFEIKEQK
ncbi:MAG: hypothetical protein ACTSQF_07955 [Candidatus Heimdallarchaeaceae archaeon]